METVYVNVTSNDNLQADEHNNYSNNSVGNKNSTNCGNCEESKLTLKPLSITQQKLFETIKAMFGCNYQTIGKQSTRNIIFSTEIKEHPSDGEMIIMSI